MSSKKSHDGDERFSRVQKDPRFWEMPEKERKIKIDKRFQSMFHDKRFKVTYTVDKRGRPVNHTSTEDLKRFYKLSDSEEEEVKKKDDDDDGDDDDEEEQVDDEEQLEEEEEEKEEASDVSEEDSDSGEEDSDSGPDLARGKGNVETSSDEDEEDDVDAVLRREEEEIQHDWGELCKDAPRRDEVSSRLAVCNMDWDRLKAKDLLALVNSFTPAGGAVLSVKIYPSEFGKERLKLEESQGPMELRSLPEDEEDDTEEERVYREKLRDYQFKRLKYFYAVVECDSATTAQKIYEECDGYEYESSCSVLDLRFIPDDMTFEEQPKDKATDVNLPTYTPKLFSSSATSTSKVQLTWDETDHDRVTALNRKFTNDELLEMDFNAYLASSSEEDEEEEGVGGEEVVEDEPVTEEEEEEQKEKKRKKKRNEEHISKYRELLRGIQDKERRQQEDKDMEMEITWVPGLKETTEQLVKKKLEGKDKLTPWEDFLQKKREKKKMKKTERKQGLADVSDDDLPADVDLSDPYFAEELGSTDMKKPQKKKKKKKEEEERTEEEEEELQKQKAAMALLMEDDEDESKHKHFNYDRLVRQQNLSRKKKQQLQRRGDALLDDDPFQLDVKDPRFQAMFTNPLYNLDPSHPSYRKTKATQSILEEKRHRREEEEQRRQATPTPEATPTQDSQTTRRQQTEPSLSLLVKSVKRKTEQFQARKKKQKLL
ncbi:ESF1 homolog isoform 1-T1 [Pholidichthys leucotaenia]